MKISFFLNAVIALFITQLSLHASQSSVLWHNSATGAVKIMPIDGMNPTPGFSVVDSSNVNLVPRGMGDFTGDGQPDILFHNQNSGNLRIWKMDGTVKADNIQVLGSSNTNLKIAGIGDFDQDGDNDIATFNTNSGAMRIWVMDDITRIDNVLVLTGANTNLVPRGVGDMNNDGVPDLVLRNNNSGAVRIWTMNSDFTRLSNEYIRSSSNTNLELRGVVDINGDGNNDILNYNTSTGVLRAWLMDGDLTITENAEIVQDVNLAWSARSGYSILSNATPEKVVEQAMQAQVNGDIEGFLAHCALKGASSEQVVENRAMLNAVKDNVSLSDFSFEPLATGIYKDNTLAIVRGITSYTINGEFREKDGVFCYLKKEDNQWKLVRIFPDSLLNQEIYESSLGADSDVVSNLSVQDQRVLKSTQGPHSVKELNEKLNDLLNTGYIDEGQLVWDAFFATVGLIPHPVTKAVAISETVLGLSKKFGELAYEYGYGESSKMKSLIWRQIAVGFAQIVVDVHPVTSTPYGIPLKVETDAVAAGLNQLEENLKMKRCVRRFQIIMRDPKFEIKNPYLTPYEQKAYAEGIRIDSSMTTIPASPMPYLYPYVAKIRIKDPIAMGTNLPFKVVGQVEFPDSYKPVNDVLLKLGGKTMSNGHIYLALDITSMAQEVVATGSPILKFNDTQLKSEDFGSVTCSMGKQSFEVKLTNGSTTRKVMVETFMNDLGDINTAEYALGSNGIMVKKGGNRNFHIFGFFGIEDPKVKELPSECFDMKIDNEDIATLKSNAIIQGLEDGETNLEVKLKVSTQAEYDFRTNFPIKVASSCPMRYNIDYDPDWDKQINLDIQDKNKDGHYEDRFECTYYASGHLEVEYPVIDDALNGTQKQYYESGEPLGEYPMVNSKRNGVTKEYYESGKPSMEVPYVDGKKNGLEIRYYESGEPYTKTPYVDGKKNGLGKQYYESGETYWDIPYVNNEINGIAIQYYKSEIHQREMSYVDGMWNGISKGYYESGLLKWEIPYVNGVKNGTEVFYHDYTGHDKRDYILYPWVNDMLNGDVQTYRYDVFDEKYIMLICTTYVDNVDVGSCMP